MLATLVAENPKLLPFNGLDAERVRAPLLQSIDADARHNVTPLDQVFGRSALIYMCGAGVADRDPGIRSGE